MSYEQKDGSGALFKNAEKETEQHPDYRGSIRIAGVDYWLSAWIKQSKNGVKYMSLSANPKVKRDVPTVKPMATEKEFDDQIPF